MIFAVSAFVVLALGNIRAAAPTHDETTHLAAGWSLLRTGDPRVNREHPPLIKVLAALPLRSLGWDSHSRASWLETGRDDREQWRFAQRLLYALRDGDISGVPTEQAIPGPAFRNDVEAIFRRARTTLMLLIGPLLIAVIGFWAFGVWGGRSWILPVVLFAFDPNFIAHAGLVTTDAGLALLLSAAAYFFWRCSRHFSVFNCGGFALAMALAHMTKFSAVILWPALLLAAALGARQQLRRLLLVAGIGLAATLVLIWAWDGRTWVAGLAKALLDALGREAYLGGMFDTSGSGFRTYFLWAILLKTPLVTLTAFAAAAWMCVRARRRELAFILIPALVYFVVASGSSLNIGHRHVLPVYPFLYVLCGALPRRWLLLTPVAALSALFVFAPITPLWANHLAYFNEIAGGPAGGSRYLIDSNLDWGQDLRRLGRWAAEHGVREPIDLAYFGTAEPRYYGIAFSNFSERYLLAPPLPLSRARARIFAISVNERVRGRDGNRDAFRRFLLARRARKIGQAGMTIEIYEMAAASRASPSAVAPRSSSAAPM